MKKCLTNRQISDMIAKLLRRTTKTDKEPQKTSKNKKKVLDKTKFMC